MLVRLLNGWLLLAMLLVSAGCGGSGSQKQQQQADTETEEVRLVKEQIAVYEKMAAELEQAKTKSQYNAIKPALEEFERKLSKLNEQLNSRPSEAKAKAETSLKKQIDQTMERYRKAKFAERK